MTEEEMKLEEVVRRVVELAGPMECQSLLIADLVHELRPLMQPIAVSAPTDNGAAIRAAYCKEYALPVDEIDYDCLQWTAFVSGFAAALAAAPVSGQGASIDGDEEFERLVEAFGKACGLDDHGDQARKAYEQLVAHIDSRPRSEDSRAKVLEEACHALHTQLAYPTEACTIVRALASTTPQKEG